MNDQQRIEQGRQMARLVMRKVFAGRDFSEVTVCLVHESAKKVFQHVLAQGGNRVEEGWALLVADRSRLPAEAAMPADQLPFMISAGALHLLTGLSLDDIVSAAGGEA